MANFKDWQRLEIKDSQGKSIRGIYYRDYQGTRSYRIMEMTPAILDKNGKKKLVVDFLGVMPVESVIRIRTTLQENRKNSVHPLTYKEMIETERMQAQKAAIDNDREVKAALAQAHKEKNSTIARYYTETYWPERQKRRGSHNQNRTVDGHFRNWIKPFVGEIPFAEFTYKDIDKIIQAVREAGKTETTVKHIVDTLANIWNRAVADEIISKSFPRKESEHIVVDNEKTCFLNRDEADELLATLRTWEPQTSLVNPLTMYGFAVISLHAGLRLSEISSLTWQQIAANKVVNTKNRKTRAVHYDVPEIAEMLEERRGMVPNHPLDFVFPEPCGPGALSKAVSKEFARVVAQLGFNDAPHRLDDPLEKIDFHALRHTFASWLAMEGRPLYDIMVLMGHSSLKMVLRYARLSPEHTKKSAMSISRKTEAKLLAEENRSFFKRHEADRHPVQ